MDTNASISLIVSIITISIVLVGALIKTMMRLSSLESKAKSNVIRLDDYKDDIDDLEKRIDVMETQVTQLGVALVDFGAALEEVKEQGTHIINTLNKIAVDQGKQEVTNEQIRKDLSAVQSKSEENTKSYHSLDRDLNNLKGGLALKY